MGASAQREFLCTVSGLPGYWAALSGRAIDSESRLVRDGGTLVADVITDPPETEIITVSRPYKPERDKAVRDRLQRLVGVFMATITEQDTGRLLDPVGDPTVYPDATLVGMTPPDRDAESGEGARLELRFRVGQAA